MKKILILFICLLLSTSCGNYRELENIGIATSIAVDYIDNNYNINIEILTKDENIIINGKGNTLVSALENAASKSKYNLYFAHLECVLITKNINIEEISMFLLRNNEISANLYLLLTDSIDIFNKTDNIGSKIKRILKVQQVNNFFLDSHDLINNKTFIMPFYKDNTIDNYVIISNNEIVYNLNVDQYKLLKMLNGKSNYNYKYIDNSSIIQTYINKVKTKYTIKDNKIMISIKINHDINEYTYNIDTANKENIRLIENILSDNIKNELYVLLNDLKEKNINILNMRVDNINNYNYELNIKSNINKKGLFRK